MEESELESDINEFFEAEYEGRYRVSADIDYDRSRADIYIVFEEGSEKPGVGGFVDEVIADLSLENSRMEADWQPENRRYDITIHEQMDRPLPDD